MKTQSKICSGFAGLILSALLCGSATDASAAINITSANGWLESLGVVWEPVEGASHYDVSYSGEGLSGVKVDDYLVSRYPDGIHTFIPGLKAGSYTVEIKAIGADGACIDRAETGILAVEAHRREGFSFIDGNMPGAYRADGTLKEDARVIYVSAASVNTVACDVITKRGGQPQTQTGLANILNAYGKGFEKRPLAVRIVGTVSASEFDGLKDGNYINLQGNNNTDRTIAGITIEGIGDDATLYGYGICFKRSDNIEIRNLGIMLFGDDAISMDTDNTHIWLHNIDFFYGRPGSDADQVKGDGSIDMKYYSTFVTISYNHFFDSGKVMGCGGATGEKKGNLSLTFHHNWFDHADSRCPRLHYITAHIYNNYYDGVSVYGIGNTSETSAFVEGNYFRNVKRPMMISGQGTDAYDPKTGTYTLKGTFSGQNGGMTKEFDNVFAECEPKFVSHLENPVQFDAYSAAMRSEVVPESFASVKGGWKYSNFDTAPSMYPSQPDASADVPGIVTSFAGQYGGGDFKWTFSNPTDDPNHDVNQPLKAAITAYKSKLVSIQAEETPGQTGIEAILADGVENMEVYDLNGRRVVDALTALPAGVYIVKKGADTRKITVGR